MRYLILLVGFIIMGINITIASESALFDEENNIKVKKRILKKVSYANLDVSSLTSKEKEWLYETHLLSTLRDLKSHNYSNPEDISNTLGRLARFYMYKDKEEFAKELCTEKANLDLRSALLGDEILLGNFNRMIKEGHLKNSNFIEKIIRLCQQDPDEYSKGKYEYFVEKDEFKEQVEFLAEVYNETLKRHKQDPMPLHDNVLKLILEKRINGKQ